MKSVVCRDCLHEQDTTIPCEKCDSHAVILVEVLEEHFGDRWRGMIEQSISRRLHRCSFCHAPPGEPCRTVLYEEHVEHGNGQEHAQVHAARLEWLKLS